MPDRSEAPATWTRLSEMAPRILVLGDAILDHYIYGEVHRVSPEAPVPIVSATGEQYFPGGACNVMANLAGLGAEVFGLAVVAREPNSIHLEQLLTAAGVGTREFVQQGDWVVPRKCRVMTGRQHALRIDYEQHCRIDAGSFERLTGSAQRLIPECDAIVISDYAKGTLSTPLIQSVIAMARVHGRPVIVDPKGSEPERYCGASVLTPNRAETKQLTGLPVDDFSALERAMRSLRRITGADWIVVTCGADGLAIAGESMHVIPAHSSRALDVSGAGDTVVAALAFGLAGGLGVTEAALIANALAAHAVEFTGIAVLSRQQFLTAAGDLDAPPAVVTTQPELNRLTSRLRRRGRRVVFTNGCFDVLHRGHVQYLEQSRALGDVLVVGVNSDESVSRLKGRGRPVNCESDRAALLASLQCVDHVVIFGEDTPYRLIKELRPHVLTKGGDYRGSDVVGHDLVDETVILPLAPGRSTSATLRKLRNGRCDSRHAEAYVRAPCVEDERNTPTSPVHELNAADAGRNTTV